MEAEENKQLVQWLDEGHTWEELEVTIMKLFSQSISTYIIEFSSQSPTELMGKCICIPPLQMENRGPKFKRENIIHLVATESRSSFSSSILSLLFPKMKETILKLKINEQAYFL